MSKTKTRDTMSASNVRTKECMFHIQFPARKDFWTWTELGCLARALGFPKDIIRHSVDEEVETEEEGMRVQQLNRMIELKLLNQVLHRSFNMHTSDWNLCVIRKAVQLLNLSALSFEEVHNIRIAYATYEAVDMKGLVLEQRTLLRTLKMCHRVISPKKLMHRVKHMRSRLEESNRLQLYEFFDLILWCDYMEHYQEAHKVGEAEGKEKDLYNLVDFETLLSHQDQRRSRALDQRYLVEEWDFGREALGSKQMFKGEVVYTDQRIEQTRTQKKNYRGLKKAVNQSQGRVYRAHAGSIRQRPISAPDTSGYSTPRGTPRARTARTAAMYQSVQRRLNSASSRDANSRMDLPDRPTIPEYVRAHTPSVVTSQDLDEASLKMKMLRFDIITLETRCEVKKKEKMDFYIPEYQTPAKEDNSDRAGKGGDKREEHWTPEIIDKLAYPPYHLPTYHAHTCDARFRGWKPAGHRGRQKIVTAPTFDRSPHGQLLAGQRSAMLAPVTDLHKDYVVRYTSRQQAVQQQRAKRPCTAPAASPRSKPLKRLGCRSAGHYSRQGDADGSATTPRAENVSDDHPTGEDSKNEELAPLAKSYPDPYGKYSQDQSTNVMSKEAREARSEEAGRRGTSPLSGQAPPSRPQGAGDGSVMSKGDDAGEGGKEEVGLAPGPSKNGPSRRHCGSKVVDVGLIGTITLLESIQEHETEDHLTSTTLSTTPSPPSTPDHHHPTTGAPPRPENLDQSSRSIPAGWSRRPQSPVGSKERAAAAHVNLLRSGEGAGMEDSAPRADLAVKNLPPEPDSKTAGQVRAGVQQKPKERFLPSDAVVTKREKASDEQNQNQNQNQNLDQPVRVQEELALRAERRHSAELRKPRVNSAASSTLSDVSDPREAPAALTSVTVTIKNKDQHVSRTRVIGDDDDDQPGVKEGNTPSPIGFKRLSPCITSTPRRRRPSPTITTPTSQQAPRKHGQANRGNTTFDQNGDPARGPDSAGRGLGKKNLSLLPSETDSDSRLNWVQDQILAMNSACEEKPREEEETEKTLNETPLTEDAAEQDRDKKPSIKFSKEQAFLEKRQSDYKQYQKRRMASEGALKLKSYDLNTEMARRYIFNKTTTRRLIHRVQDVISPELRTRIRTGDTGLKVA